METFTSFLPRQLRRRVPINTSPGISLFVSPECLTQSGCLLLIVTASDQRKRRCMRFELSPPASCCISLSSFSWTGYSIAPVVKNQVVI